MSSLSGGGDEALLNHRGEGYTIYVANHAQDISQHLQPLGGLVYMALEEGWKNEPLKELYPTQAHINHPTKWL